MLHFLLFQQPCVGRRLVDKGHREEEQVRLAKSGREVVWGAKARVYKYEAGRVMGRVG